ncbi:MAG: hypothetical protein K2X50_03155 [Gammaproteobacteria bacterium]|nr:hypothetical protein [Gammaproteobacteria bacterium]
MGFNARNIIIIVLIMALTILLFSLFQYEGEYSQLIAFLTMIATVLTMIATMAIAYIAYNQLNKIAKINLGDHMLKLDQLWHTVEIIKARKLIDEYFQRFYRVFFMSNKALYKDAVKMASKEIYKISKPDTEVKIKEYESKFIYILSLIEFFDTLGFIYSKGEIDQKNEIKSLFKDSVKFYYEINKVYIDHIHNNPDTKDRFKNFQNIYNEFKRDES